MTSNQREYAEACILNNAAVALISQNKYAEALEKFKKAHKLFHKYHKTDAVLASTLLNIGLMYENLGNKEKAETSYKESIQMYKSSPGDNRADTADAVYQLGNLYYNGTKEYAKALDCYDESLKIRKEVLGNDHLQVACSLHNKGAAHNKLEQCEEAMTCYEECLAIRRQNYGNRPHSEIADTLLNMGYMCIKDSKLDKAAEYFEEALNITTNTQGPESAEAARLLFAFGEMNFHKQEHRKCLDCWKQALRIQRAALGDHVDTAKTLHFMGAVHAMLKHPVEAILHFEQALTIYRAIGMNDEDYSSVIYNLQVLRHPQVGGKLDLRLPSKE